MPLEPLRVHSLTVVDDDDGRVLVVKIRRKEHVNSLCTRIKRVGDEFLNGLGRTCVETLGEQLNNPVAEPYVDVLGGLTDGREKGQVTHGLINP